MKIHILLAIFILNLNSALAVVDMKTANFSETFTDLSALGSGFDLRIQRTYNSRTIYSGLFGFGWCSDFETRLETTAEGNLKVTECGAGVEVLYVPKKFDGKKVDITVGAIIDEVRKRNQGMTDKALTELTNELKADSNFRDEFAKRIGLKGNIEKDTTYYASGRENETISKQESVYKRSLADGTFQHFDFNGNLVAIYDRNSNSLKLIYDKNKLTGVLDNNGRRLTLSYDPTTKRLKRIAGPNNLKAEYVFKGEDLKEVTMANGKKEKYEYDEVHNLTKIIFANGKTKTLTYNQDKDWVTSFKNEKGCIETYEYKVNPEDPKNHYWSTVIKKCGEVVTNKSTFEFFHKPKTDNTGVYLYRVKSDVNGSLTDIVYHEIFGKPVISIRGNYKIEYGYFDSGLVKTKKEPAKLTSFEYKSTCNKVSKVEIDFYETESASKDKPKGSKESREIKEKVIRKVATEFNYDSKKCNLTSAKNSDGQTVKLQYDVRGRISVIEDQSLKLVKIKYDEKTGKPETVTRPGLGTIKVQYKTDGEIKEVISKEGPQVAVQVASIFNNLLEIIAPAQAETTL